MRIPHDERPEYKIEEAIMNNFQLLGYDEIYPPIRRLLIYRHSGVVDLALLPKNNQHKLVLIEAKHFSNSEAGEKVIGQLLKYYAFAVQKLGENGLQLLRKFSETSTDNARGIKKITPQQITGGLFRDLAMPQLEQGARIKPQEIGLFVAVDGEVERSLKEIVLTLHDYHNLDIHIIQLINNTLKLI